MAAQSTGSSSPAISPSSPNPNFSGNPNSSGNPSPLTSYTSLTIHNIGSMVPIKLKRSNYLPWRALFGPIFRRYKLLGVIDGTDVCPLPFLPDRSINSAFEDWYEKDQNLLIWLNSTLFEEIIPFTVGVSSSRELWVKLEQRFGGISEAHIHQLRSRPQSVQKGSRSISKEGKTKMERSRDCRHRKGKANGKPTKTYSTHKLNDDRRVAMRAKTDFSLHKIAESTASKQESEGSFALSLLVNSAGGKLSFSIYD